MAEQVLKPNEEYVLVHNKFGHDLYNPNTTPARYIAGVEKKGEDQAVYFGRTNSDGKFTELKPVGVTFLV